MPESTCRVDGCEAPHYSKGMCKPHYRKDYYLRNKERENASNKAYREARPEYWKERWATYAAERWGEERAERQRLLTERLEATHKECTKCGEGKPKTDFHNDPRRRDGLHSWCKACFGAHMASTASPEKERVRQRVYLSDPERRERAYQRHREWHARTYPNNPEMRARAIENAKQWALDNPDRATLNSRKGANARRARKKAQAVGVINYADILERDGMVCHLCGDEIPDLKVLHFDHVIPLSKGGPHSMDNIKPSHATCNLRKGAKLVA